MSEPSDDDGDEMLYAHIRAALDNMIENGLIQVVGIGDDGEWFYAATDKGLERYRKLNQEFGSD